MREHIHSENGKSFLAEPEKMKKPKCPECEDDNYLIDWDNDELMCLSCGHKYPK